MNYSFKDVSVLMLYRFNIDVYVTAEQRQTKR